MYSLRWAAGNRLHVTPALAYGASVARAMFFRPKQSPHLMRGLLRPNKSIRDGIGRSKSPPRNDRAT
jgi:hypothetical protein